MPAETSTEIKPEELAQIVVSVFQTMVGLAVVECDAPPALAQPEKGLYLTSAVHLSGDWEGTLVLQCDRQLACRFAGRYICLGDPDRRTASCECVLERRENCQMSDVVPDVLGELVNMIGGNVKCVLDMGLSLSMPEVAENDCMMRAGGYDVRQQTAFECAEGIFLITVLRPKA